MESQNLKALDRYRKEDVYEFPIRQVKVLVVEQLRVLAARISRMECMVDIQNMNIVNALRKTIMTYGTGVCVVMCCCQLQTCLQEGLMMAH